MEPTLKAGKMLILLDGLDEVPAKQENPLIKQIQDLCQLYHG